MVWYNECCDYDWAPLYLVCKNQCPMDCLLSLYINVQWSLLMCGHRVHVLVHSSWQCWNPDEATCFESGPPLWSSFFVETLIPLFFSFFLLPALMPNCWWGMQRMRLFVCCWRSWWLPSMIPHQSVIFLKKKGRFPSEPSFRLHIILLWFQGRWQCLMIPWNQALCACPITSYMLHSSPFAAPLFFSLLTGVCY